MAASFLDDEVIADSEEEREVDVGSVLPQSRRRDTGGATQSNSAAAALKDFLETPGPMPRNDDPSTISSFTASRHIADTSISSIDASLPQVRATLTGATSFVESISTATSDGSSGTKKPRPKPRPRFYKPDDESAPPSTISSVSISTNAAAPKANACPGGDEQRIMANLSRDISCISSASTSKSATVPALDLLGTKKSLPAKGKARPAASVTPEIITISSDHEHNAPVGAPVTKKTKLSPPKASSSKVDPVPPAKDAAGSTASRPIKHKKIRVVSDSEDGGDDPMLLKVVRKPPQPIEQAKSPAASIPSAPQDNAGSDSDFNPAAADLKRKSKRKSKVTVEADGEEEEGSAPKKKKTKGKEKEKSGKRKSKGDAEDLPKDKEAVKASASASRGSVIKSKEFIEDSYDDAAASISTGPPTTAQDLSPKRKLDDDGSGKKPSKKAKHNDPEGSDGDLLEDGRTQRSSLRVAVSKSVAEVAHQELQVEEKISDDKPQDKKRVKSKNRPKNGDQPTATDVDHGDTTIADEGGTVVEQAGKKSKSKKRRVVEVVLDARPAAQTDGERAVALEPIPTAREPPRQEPEPEPPAGPAPPIPKSCLPEHVVGKGSRPSTPTISAPTSQGRGSAPYWRRPNRPLTDILTQTTPGSQARPSGLHKRISIVPLHLNRKPPPPPLPPMPRKGKALKAGSGSDDDDDETPKARLKRLAAEFEALEGMDSKKANDRRKEINEEMGRLAN